MNTGIEFNDMEKKYFIVTSHGWSASNWVSHSLNLHPEIVCSHSARNVLADDKDLQSNSNLKNHLAQLHKGYVGRQEKDFKENYAEIEKMGEGNYYGSVHLYRLRDLPVVNQKYAPFPHEYSLMNLVRNPVNLVWSGYGQFKDLFRYDINELHWTVGKVLNESREFVFGIGDRYNINIGDYENLAFIGAACVLGSLRKDLDAFEEVKTISQFHYKGHLKMEEVTSDRNKYKEFITQLLPGITVTEAYLDDVFASGIINQHKHDTKKVSPQERYLSWSDWQREVFNFYMDKYQLTKPYSDFGYDLSFVK